MGYSTYLYNMGIKVKNIKLDEDYFTKLHIQALKAGYNNLQNYLEALLIEQSKSNLIKIAKK